MTREWIYTTNEPYEIPINDKPYRFYTLVSRNGVIAWTPDSEQQHVNPQYRDKEMTNPIAIGDVTEMDVEGIIAQILLFQTKKIVPKEDIKKHEKLGKDILTGFYNVKF